MMWKFIIIAAIFNNVISAKRLGEEDDKWIWGYEGGNNSNDTNGRIQIKAPQPKVSGTTEPNPCLIKDPETPDFRSPGRRTSEASEDSQLHLDPSLLPMRVTSACILLIKLNNFYYGANIQIEENNRCPIHLSRIEFHEYIWNVYIEEFRSKRYVDCEKYKGNDRSFIIGGHKALWGEFPHMGAIGWKKVVGEWSFKCGSTLISPNFVLTAAHCTRVSSSDTTVTDSVPKIVRFVDLNNHQKQTDRIISKIIVHPEYKPPNQTHDIALMKLGVDVSLSTFLHPACLWNSFDTSCLGTKGIITGWGATKAGPGQVTTSETLQTGVVDIIDSTTCDELLRPYCNRNQCGVLDHQMCAGLLAGAIDTCQGDSGGPLQVKIPAENSLIENTYYVIGVTSYGFGCALENSPGVYTRVSSFIDWIEGIVWPE